MTRLRRLAEVGDLRSIIAAASSQVVCRPMTGVRGIWTQALEMDPQAICLLAKLIPDLQRYPPRGSPAEVVVWLAEVVGAKELGGETLLRALAARLPRLVEPIQAFMSERAAAAAAAARRAAQQEQDFLVGRGVPEQVAHPIAWGQLRPCKALEAARKWLDEWRQESTARQAGRPFAVTPRWLVFCGEMDTSKSTAAAWLVSEWERARSSDKLAQRALFVSWEWGLSIWAHKQTEDEPAEPVTGLQRAHLLQVGLLVLDDVGQEALNTPAQRAAATEARERVVFGRLSRGLPVVETTNLLTLDEMIHLYGRERLRERMVESARRIMCEGDGHRTVKKEA